MYTRVSSSFDYYLTVKTHLTSLKWTVLSRIRAREARRDKIKKDAQFAWQRLPVSRDFPIEARLDGRR
jgi:hypothetical protein